MATVIAGSASSAAPPVIRKARTPWRTSCGIYRCWAAGAS